MIQHAGCYYWCASEEDRRIVVRRAANLTDSGGQRFVAWEAPRRGPYSSQLWAPELHRLDGRWYIYVAASDGRNETHRMIVLEAEGDEPTGEFRFKAELYTGDDLATRRANRWAIDGTILEHGGRRYLLWSGWADDRDVQWLYIATMSNPWTVSSQRVRICANDDHLWERVDETIATRGLNEAPQVLQRGGRVLVVFSASASWEVSYKLGLLELASGGNPMDPRAWKKHSRPVFERSGRTWGVGHNCFVRSPDGTEDWLVFHAKTETRPNWKRVIHLQRFTWDADGLPVFGRPVDPGVVLARPSGEVETDSGSEAASANEAGAREVALGRAALAAAVGDRPMVRSVKVVE